MTYTRNSLDRISGTGSKRFAICIWVLLLALAGPALLRLHAQDIGGLTGTVTDPSDAAIPGARIMFTNVATGLTRQVATSSFGLYTATLTPGSYNITVEAPGFQRFQEDHVVVEVGAIPTVNIKMLIGERSETVQVAASAVTLNTTQPQLDTMLEPQEVADLPLEINNTIRQISSFATLAPGVKTGAYGSVVMEGGAAGQINAAGTYYNGLQLDTSSAVNSNPPYEMVDEFRVLRSTFSAKYGLVQGAVSYNMRSGTNKLHGDAFLIDRNSIFDSPGFFPTAFSSTGKPIAPADQEVNWGGTIGGPIIVPKVYNGRNRTFFLFSLDMYSKNQAVPTIGTVPTHAMKTGDFSKFVDSTDTLIPIYDPQTGKQFQCNNVLNVICPGRIDPLSASILPLIPDPNATGTNFGLVSNMNPVIPSVPYITHAWGLTLNHALSQTQNISFTWWRNYYSVVQEEQAPIVPASSPLTGQQSGIDLSNVWLANYEKTVTPNLVLTAGFAAENKMQDYVNDQTNQTFAGVVGGTTFPLITFDGQNAPTPYGVNDGSIIQYDVDNIGYNLFNNWLWVRGRHTFNFGGEYHHYSQNTISNYSGGQFNFSQQQTSIPNSNDPNFTKYGSSFASFLLGTTASASRSAATAEIDSTKDVSSYIQDDIKLNKRLTVNAGLRWDIMVPYTMNQNNNVFFTPNGTDPLANGLPGGATAYGTCTGCAGYNRVNIHWRDVGPHVGFVYSLTPKTVVQAGYFITYLGYDSAYGQGEGLGAPVSMSQLLAGQYQVNSTGGPVAGFGSWSAGANNPLPAVTPKPFSTSLGTATSINFLDPAKNGEAPHYQAWSLSLQRQLPWNMLVTVAYSANRVTHLTGYNINPISQPDPSVLQYGSLLTSNINSPAAIAAGFTSPYPAFASQFGASATVGQSLKPYPQYSSVARAFDQAGTTFYNALQIQADKHTSHGLSLLASLTLPSQYDNLTTPLNKYNPAPEWALTSDSYETKFATTYSLPIGIGQRWLNSGRTGRLAGGWQVAAILTYNNGGTLQITQSGAGLNGNNRPNIVPGVKMSSGGYNRVTQYFEGKLAALPVLFTEGAFASTGSNYVLGNANRTYSALRGPFYPTENLSAKKLFNITESTSFIVRIDYFNAFNRFQMGFPTTNINSSSFGEINSKSGGTNRQGQITASFQF